jgi:predicted nucleotidyltransferase
LNYYDFGRTLIDAGAELVGYHWNHESVSNMGQAAESGTTMLQLEMALLEGLGTNVADTVTLGGYATYQYRNGDINDSEYGDRMIGMGLSLLGGVGTLRAAGLGSVTVGQATQVALRTAQTTARAAGRALSQIELNPTALTQFNSGIPLNLLRWKQTGNPLAKIAEGFGTAAERAAPVSVTTGSAYNAANFGDVLGNWSRANGYVPARNIAGLTVNKAKQLEAKILEAIPGAEGVRVFGSRTRGVSTSDIDVVVKGSIDASTSAYRTGVKKVQDFAKNLGIPKPADRPRVDINVSPSYRSFLRWSSETGDPSRGLPRLKRME